MVQWPVPSTATAAPFTVSEEPISAVPLTWMPPAASAALMILSPPSMVVIATAGAMVSTVSVVEVVAELPAASVATAVTVSAPWPAGVTDVVQWPVPSTATAAPFTVSEEPISAVPLIWMPPAASAALMILSPPSMVVIATAGAMVSSVKLSAAVPVLPKPSVWLATMVCAPSANPVGVNDHAPWVSAVAVATIGLPSIVKCTTVLARPVPLSASLEVMWSMLEAPVSNVRISVTDGPVVLSV